MEKNRWSKQLLFVSPITDCDMEGYIFKDMFRWVLLLKSELWLSSSSWSECLKRRFEFLWSSRIKLGYRGGMHKKGFFFFFIHCSHSEIVLSELFRRRREWHPTPVLLPGKSHGWRSLEGCSPWGRWGSDMTEQLHFHFSLSCVGEGNGNPLQCSCLENPRDGGAWWAAICGVTRSRTRLKWLSSSSSNRAIQEECILFHGIIFCHQGKFQETLILFPELLYNK